MERNTRQRNAIKTVIDEAGRPLSTAEILVLAQQQVAGLGIATVYRNLKSLCDSGELIAVNLPSEVPRYETNHRPHHHHFKCTACDRVFDVHSCPGSLLDLAPTGFTVARHDLTLYGSCAECNHAPAASGPTVRKSLQSHHGHSHSAH